MIREFLSIVAIVILLIMLVGGLTLIISNGLAAMSDPDIKCYSVTDQTFQCRQYQFDQCLQSEAFTRDECLALVGGGNP